MGFGRNPHVDKAIAAEDKAREATDAVSEARAYLEAAHLWDRAAAKEKPGKKRGEYEAKAQVARDQATAAEQKPKPSLGSVAARLKLVKGDPPEPR
jgi:hypothetical protein